MALSNKKILITGAGGFIGLEIVKELKKYNAKIYAMVHKNLPNELLAVDINLISADLRDSCDFSADLSFDIIIHAAGRVSDYGDDREFEKINYLPVKSLCKLAKEKFIFISTTDVFGIKDFHGADENAPYLEFPKNPYPKYKILSEIYLKNNCKNFVIIRPAAVFGKTESVLEKRIVNFLKISPFIIHFGRWHGKNRWPLADVKNVAKTVVSCCIFSDFDNDSINVIDSCNVSIDDYYKILAGKHFPGKKFKTICLSWQLGCLIGRIVDFLNNFIFKNNILDPSYYALHHISSNLDFSSGKMLYAIKKLENAELENSYLPSCGI